MGRVRVSQYLVEALVPKAAFSPTTVTGAGVSQYLVEALITDTEKARVSQYLIEALVTESDAQSEPPEPPDPGGSGGVRVFGYAG